MREIEEARAALDRVENTVERYRWILRNPRKARDLLSTLLSLNDIPGNRRDDLAAIEFSARIDQECVEEKRAQLPRLFPTRSANA